MSGSADAQAESEGSALPTIAVLGPLTVSTGGIQRKMGTRADRTVLSVLAVATGWPVAIGTLISRTYGVDEPTSGGRRGVQAAVWRLRRALGSDVISTLGESYRLEPSRCRVDVVAFEELITRGRHLITRGDAAGAAEQLAAALALWRGEPFADWQANGDGLPEAQRLIEMRLGAIEDHAEALTAAGRAEEGIGHLDLLLATEPLREHAWRLLADAWLQLDRPTEAQRALDRARTVLAGAGLEPGSELRSAAERSRDRSRDRWFSPNLAAVRDAAPLVAGREQELAVLDAWLSSPGVPNLAIISGPAGVGKTRLAAEATWRCVGQHVVAEYADPYLTTPFQPFGDIVRQLLATQTPDVRSRLSSGALSVLVPAAPAPAVDIETAETDQHRLFDSVGELMVAAAGNAGLVLVIDDAHLLPATSAHLLRHVLSRRSDAPIRALLLTRDGTDTEADAAAAFAELLRVVPHHTFRLGGLDADATADLLGAALGPDVDSSVAATVHEITTGNPLFIRQLSADRTALADLDAAAAAIWKHEGVAAAVRARIGTLPPSGRGVVEMASVHARQFDRRVLAAVAAIDRSVAPDELGRGLMELSSAGVIQPLGGDRYAFTHDLFRSVSRLALPDRRRIELHLATGRALIPFIGRGVSVDDVAHHLAAAWPACPAREAAQYLRSAGRASLAQFDADGAAAYFLRALDLLGQDHDPADDEQRLELSLAAGRALADCDRPDDARREYLATAELARRLGRVAELVTAALGHADTFASRGLDDPVSFRLLTEAVEFIDQVDDATAAEVVALLYIAEPTRAEVLAERTARQVSSGSEADRAMGMLDELWMRRLGAARVETAERMIEVGERLHDDRLLAHGVMRHWCGSIHAGTGSFNDPRAGWLEGAVAAADDPLLTWRWRTWSVVVDIVQDRIPDAVRTLQHLRSVWVPAQVARDRLPLRPGRLDAILGSQEGWIAVLTGHGAVALRSLDSFRSQTIWRGLDVRYFVVMMQALVGSHPAAAATMDELLAEPTSRGPRTPDWLSSEVQFGHAAAVIGHPQGMERAWNNLLPFGGLTAMVGATLYYGSVSFYLGLIAYARGDHGAAIELLEQAAAANETAGEQLRRRETLEVLGAIRDGENPFTVGFRRVS